MNASTEHTAFEPLELLSRLDWAEDGDLEFKSAKGGIPRNLWETYSAMANSMGGVIILGVEADGSVSGVPDPSKTKKSFWDTINNRTKVSANLLGETDVIEIPHDGDILIAIHVPRATRSQRPVFLGSNPLTGTFRRNYEGDYHCTELEVGRMLADRAEVPADSLILDGYSFTDIDPLSLGQYRQRFASHKPTHPWLSEDDRSFLLKLGGWRVDRRSGEEGLTVAGLLMFGRSEAITEGIPEYHVDFREKLSKDPMVRWTDRITIDGTWNANLFQFYQRIIQRLSQDLRLPFQLDSDLFRRGESIVHEAIREALVNALIHADYRGQGGIVIEKYRDRFEFSNPGSLLISFDQLLRGGVSECRNKALQQMFMYIGVAEKAGSGIDRIRQGWSSQHWRWPMVREQFQPDRVQWTLPMVSLIPEDSLARLRARFGGSFSSCTSHEVQALVTAELEGFVDNAGLRQLTQGHASDMTRVLQGLVSKGMLTQEGFGRWTRYHLPDLDESGSTADESGASSFAENDTHSLEMVRDSLGTGGSSLDMRNYILDKGVQAETRSQPMIKSGKVPEDSGEDEQAELLRIAAPVRARKRIAPSETEKVIMALCMGRWLTKMEIAKLLSRNPEDIRHRFLNSMSARGLLRLRYPESPNRRDQAYTSTTTDNS